MKPGYSTVWIRISRLAATSIFVLTALVGDARAACFAATGNPLAATPSAFSAGAGAAARAAEGDGSPHAIVGLWNAEFLIGEGPDRYDQSFQQFHEDGTELMLSNGLPPVLGNVCVGVWKRSGRSIRLKHMAWNWNADGSFAGTFVMNVTLRVSRRGSSYTGTWSADNFDVSGELIPELSLEGIVRGTRIEAD